MAAAEANHAVLGNQLSAAGVEDDTPEGERLRAEIGVRIQATKLREFATLGVVLGYRYEDSPVVVADGTAPPARDFINYVPTSRPGSLAPHAWLHDGSSLYDLFGTGFTLLAAAQAERADLDRIRAQCEAVGVPIQLLQCEEGGIASLYPARYTLIRPDQHVAWRGDAWPEDGRVLLERVTGRLLG